MSVTIIILWFMLSLAITALILHWVGKQYGAHVALSTSTCVAVFMASGTAAGFFIGFTRWLVL